ncbi:MAG: Rha family transcriptional regulator [Methylotenera sp.]
MSNLLQIPSLTMSSLEIAELVESRHDSVKRTMERLSEKRVIQLPPLVNSEFINSLEKKQVASVYQVCKRDSYIIVAQLSPEFTARLVDRWQELENHKLPTNYLEALEALLESEKANQAAQAQLDANRHKVECADIIARKQQHPLCPCVGKGYEG